jgi:hypothetical protein
MAVVKLQTKSAWRLFPARSSTPVVSVAVYVVLEASGADGVNVAVDPATDTVPATGEPPFKRNVAVVTLAGAMASEKVAETVVPADTPVAPSSGVVDETVGGVVSGASPVVKLQTNSTARLLPAASSIPVVRCAV